MRFFNRATEIGLNILQTMHMQPTAVHSVGTIAAQLKESELFVYKIMRLLREKGYVYAFHGPKGGYKISPDAAASNLKDFLQDFNREYRPSPILTARHASERANRVMTAYLSATRLKHIFESGTVAPTPILRIRQPDPDDFPPGGAA